MDFEIVGEITSIETFASASEHVYTGRMGRAGGASARESHASV
jgi:hypothetical protein